MIEASSRDDETCRTRASAATRERSARAAISRPAISTSCATSSRLSAWSPLPARSLRLARRAYPRRLHAYDASAASVEEIAGMGRAAWTIAIGEQMRDAAEALEKKAGVPFRLFDRLTGLAPNDDFVAFLAKISGKPGAKQAPPPARPACSTRCSTDISHFGGKKHRRRRGAGPAFQRVELARGNGRTSRRRSRPRSLPCSKKCPRTKC